MTLSMKFGLEFPNTFARLTEESPFRLTFEAEGPEIVITLTTALDDKVGQAFVSPEDFLRMSEMLVGLCGPEPKL